MPATTASQTTAMARPKYQGSPFSSSHGADGVHGIGCQTTDVQTTSSQPITLTDEQRAFRDVLRQFAEDKIAPRAAEVDERGEYSWENFEACRAMELPALGIPAEYGGAGADHVTQS